VGRILAKALGESTHFRFQLRNFSGLVRNAARSNSLRSHLNIVRRCAHLSFISRTLSRLASIASRRSAPLIVGETRSKGEPAKRGPICIGRSFRAAAGVGAGFLSAGDRRESLPMARS